MKKYFLTTALMGMFIAPVFGADKIITSANTCTVDVLGVSDNNAVANTIATWDAIEYTLNPGEYLPAGSEEPADCPNGSYCPGDETVYWNKDEDQGIRVCPTDYPNSDSGAKSENDCYKPCTTDDVAGAMTVVGNDYYGSGVDTCELTACVAGWHVKPGLDIGATIAEEAGTNSACIKNDGSFSETNYDGNGAKGQEYYGISGKNSFAVDYAGKGILTGHGRCSTQAGVGIWNGASTPEDVTVVDNLADETGTAGAQYCYCQVDGFTPTGGDKVMVTSAPWVFDYDHGSADYCTSDCAYVCADRLRHDGVGSLGVRAAVMNNLPALPATCEEITYTLNPGEYLPAGSEEPADCPSGYYCPEAVEVRHDAKNDQGLVLCPTDFPNSDTGAKTESDCYKLCTTDDVANSMSVVGKNYYGTGVDTCGATACIAGWHVKAELDISTIIGEEAGSNYANINNNGSFGETNFDDKGRKGQEYYGISVPMSFAVDYAGKGILTGHGRCSTQPGVREFDWETNTNKEITVVNNLTDETGAEGAQYCYCRVDGFTPTGGDKLMVTYAPWVFSYDLGSADSCVSTCANLCAGYMRHDDTYSLAFRAAVMDVTGNIGPGTCEEITYTLNPGEYLPAGSEEPADCPNGSYCPGGETVYWNKDKDQGIRVCPTDYPNSDTGAKTESDCYKQCTTDDVAGAVTVVGTDYYGGLNTCDATECITGWHVKLGLDIGETIGEEEGSNRAYINNAGSFTEMNNDGNDPKGREYYGISGKNSFAVDYEGKGLLTGHGRCSTQAGVGLWNGASTPEDVTVVDNLTDETGAEGAQYCYCQVDGFTPTGGTKAIVTSAPWMFSYDRGSANSCASFCAEACASYLHRDYVDTLAFRAAVMNNLPASPDICVANTINIDWNPDNDGAHTINQCTYDGAITLPAAPVKPGYTFIGWQLLEENEL